MSPVDGVVTRFLQEEDLRSAELLQRLDSHIQGMKENNMKTMSKYLPSCSGRQSVQMSVQSG